ncbi:MAG: type II toxin-antitoxin system HicA family toxin [Oscillospiraceae bacterium]|jgi:hypothetical protein|nr:type II toxin-antitoxin system HicA family toxin [Oscillospiraceae bacterium]
MSKKDKLIARIKSNPSDFTFDEMATLMGYLGYSVDNAGSTSGSRIAFINSTGDKLKLHKPHPGKILKPYQVHDLIIDLKARSLI